jgi:tetratricopeptide (TPR) repeat protein
VRRGADPESRAHEPDVALDARLEYLIGGALLDSQAGREREARCMLERALRDAPSSPLAARGLSDLAIAAAKMGDREAEHAAYLRALELTWQPDSRGNCWQIWPRATWRSAISAGPCVVTATRCRARNSPSWSRAAYFGLAVALDRSGDLPSALEAAKRAIIGVQLSPTDRCSPGQAVAGSPDT